MLVVRHLFRGHAEQSGREGLISLLSQLLEITEVFLERLMHNEPISNDESAGRS